jgi:GT2 family glycosyltransferase
MTTKSLDIGCGASVPMRNPFNADEVYGVDVMEGLGPTIRQADLAIEPIPFPDEMFEFMTAHDFLEHLPRVVYAPHRRNSFVEFMNEAWRVLKPGGFFVSSTPCYPHPFAFMDPTHVNYVTEQTFLAYFDNVNRWGKIYGFNGAFAVRVNEVRNGSHLYVILQKVEVPGELPAPAPAQQPEPAAAPVAEPTPGAATPMFSSVIPTHDRPTLLQRTLASLAAQSCQDFNVVVVSDAPTAPPFDQLKALDQRYTYISRSGVAGPAASRNMGLSVADGQYVLFLDDDDIFLPGHLAELKKVLQRDRPELLFCDFQVQNEDRTAHPPKPMPGGQPVSVADVTPDSVYIRNRIPNSCVAYRRDVLQDVRNETDLVIYEDWDFLLAAMKGRKLVHHATDGVVIHKSLANAPENMRRGNTRDDKIVEVMLQLYRKHPAPNMETRLARQSLMAGAGVQLDLAYF